MKFIALLLCLVLLLCAVGCQKPSDNENRNSGISSEEGAQVANLQTPTEFFAPPSVPLTSRER